jgi:hypothetical protein
MDRPVEFGTELLVLFQNRLRPRMPEAALTGIWYSRVSLAVAAGHRCRPTIPGRWRSPARHGCPGDPPSPAGRARPVRSGQRAKVRPAGALASIPAPRVAARFTAKGGAAEFEPRSATPRAAPAASTIHARATTVAGSKRGKLQGRRSGRAGESCSCAAACRIAEL